MAWGRNLPCSMITYCEKEAAAVEQPNDQVTMNTRIEDNNGDIRQAQRRAGRIG